MNGVSPTSLDAFQGYGAEKRFSIKESTKKLAEYELEDSMFLNFQYFINFFMNSVFYHE